MPGTRSTTDLAVLISRAGNAALESQKEAVFKAAMTMKNAIEGERSKALKGKDHFSRMTTKKSKTGRFVGVRPQTHKLSVWFDIKGTYNPTALLVARGPWGLIEYGAMPHEIASTLGQVEWQKGARGAKKQALTQRRLDVAFGARGLFSGATPLRTPMGPRYRVRNHPGTQGKEPWKKGSDKSRAQAARIATALVQNRVVDVWRAGRDTVITVRGEKGSFTGQGMVG